MATQISVFREAARLLGDYRIATLNDDSTQVVAFTDSWDRSVRYVLRQSFWKFALKTGSLTGASAVDHMPGYTYTYDMPCDWLRTHAIYHINASNPEECPIDCKHTLEQIHSNVATPYIRYISDDYTDPDTWPEHFAFAVACRLAFDCAERITGSPAKTDQMSKAWQQGMQLAQGPDALPEDPWLRFQLDGSMLRCTRWLLDEHSWTFALKTVTLTGDTTAVSSGYAYAVNKPADLGRVTFFYYIMGYEWMAIDFRDENGRFHTQFQNTSLRYVSTAGESSLTWTEGFRRSLLAYMELEEAKRNPQTPGAVLQAKMAGWADAFKNAKIKDAQNEHPRYNDMGTLVRARRGNTYRGLAYQQGWL